MPVTSAGHVRHPVIVLKIPADCFAKPAFQRFLGLPPKLPFDLRCIHRVPPVVSRAILDEGDELPTRTLLSRRHFIHEIAYRLDHFNIVSLIPPSYVVGLTGPSLLQH